MTLYELKHYHTSDSSESVLDRGLSYEEAVAAMERQANSWAKMDGNIVRQKDRIEYRGDGWGSAVYIEKQKSLVLKERMNYLELLDYVAEKGVDLLRSWNGNLVIHDWGTGANIKYWLDGTEFTTVKPEPVCLLP
jgi:hypothetical protein